MVEGQALMPVRTLTWRSLPMCCRPEAVSDVLHAPPPWHILEEGHSRDPVVLERGRNRDASTEHRQGEHMCLDVVCETEASALWISGLQPRSRHVGPHFWHVGCNVFSIDHIKKMHLHK
jgi:hypothetical protein